MGTAAEAKREAGVEPSDQGVGAYALIRMCFQDTTCCKAPRKVTVSDSLILLKTPRMPAAVRACEWPLATNVTQE
jgi:hypothetical protein